MTKKRSSARCCGLIQSIEAEFGETLQKDVEDLAEAVSDHSDATVDVFEVMSNKIETMGKDIVQLQNEVKKHNTFLSITGPPAAPKNVDAAKEIATAEDDIDTILENLANVIKGENPEAVKPVAKRFVYY